MSTPHNTTSANATNEGGLPSQERLRLLTQGIACLEKEEFQKAQALGEQVLALNPQDCDAWHLVGVALARMRVYERAIEALQRAVALSPKHAQFHANLGNAYYEQGNYREAIESYRRAVALDPGDNPAATLLAKSCEKQLDLGIEHHRAGRADAATACYRSVLRGQPKRADAWNLLGVIAYERHHYGEAIELFGRALQIGPSVSVYHRGMGSALLGQHKFELALSSFETALGLEPGSIEDLAHIGLCQYRMDHTEAAEKALKAALAKDPECLPALITLTDLLLDTRRLEEALSTCQRALAHSPARADLHYRLGRTFRERGAHSQGLQAVARSLAIDPKHPATHNLLGQLQKDLGRPEDAVPAYRRATELAPKDGRIRSNLLYALNYHAGLAPEDVFAEHLAWAERYGRGAQPWPRRGAHARDADRQLRVGYVSADLRAHSVAFFFEPLLAARNREATHVTCYTNSLQHDRMTERLEALSDNWRVIKGKTDDEAEAMIRADGIDILVDLSGHTRGNRMPLFARRIAPIQVTYLGYPNTTGLATMDYRLTDALADPPGLTEAFHTEELVRLDDCFLCYRPPDASPDVSASPVSVTGRISFGSFNNLAKVNAALIAQWAKILASLPDSRLILKARPLADPGTRDFIIGRFERNGIAPERIVLSGWAGNTRQHLDRYGEVDIALDTFPYHGATTTCEALWMGVPAVTCVGGMHASRVGASLLSAVGLQDLIAPSMQDYVQTAIGLARDIDRLKTLRRELRPRMAAGHLTDGAHFAHTVEAACRRMWRRWCEKTEVSIHIRPT